LVFHQENFDHGVSQVVSASVFWIAMEAPAGAWLPIPFSGPVRKPFYRQMIQGFTPYYYRICANANLLRSCPIIRECAARVAEPSHVPHVPDRQEKKRGQDGNR